MASTPKQFWVKVFEKQTWHVLGLAVLLGAVGWIWTMPGFSAGSYLGVSTSAWMALAIAVPIVHQVYVWLTWRLELHYKALSKLFGKRAFKAYAPAFIILLLARVVVLVPLAVSDRGSLSWDRSVLLGLVFVSTALALWVLISVLRYFSIGRALGADHFDESYRKRPLVREGVFRVIPNAMYTLGFLIVWVPGWLFASKAALLAAGFAHAYIWVHYYTLERPDMVRIYGSGSAEVDFD